MVGFCSESRFFRIGMIGFVAGEQRGSVLHIPSCYAGIDLRCVQAYKRRGNILFVKTSSPSSSHVILSTNYSVGGVEYPAGQPVPRELVRPDHLAALEVRPGARRERRTSGSVANFVPGVSYPIGADGLPARRKPTPPKSGLLRLGVR
jgi:hypothetical protein